MVTHAALVETMGDAFVDADVITELLLADFARCSL
jgi:hypothetical protein